MILLYTTEYVRHREENGMHYADLLAEGRNKGKYRHLATSTEFNWSDAYRKSEGSN